MGVYIGAHGSLHRRIEADVVDSLVRPSWLIATWELLARQGLRTTQRRPASRAGSPAGGESPLQRRECVPARTEVQSGREGQCLAEQGIQFRPEEYHPQRPHANTPGRSVGGILAGKRHPRWEAPGAASLPGSAQGRRPRREGAARLEPSRGTAGGGGWPEQEAGGGAEVGSAGRLPRQRDVGVRAASRTATSSVGARGREPGRRPVLSTAGRGGDLVGASIRRETRGDGGLAAGWRRRGTAPVEGDRGGAGW